MPLVEILTSLSLFPALIPWETCILNLIDKERPVSVSFVCESPDQCPSNIFYKRIITPSQTIVGAELRELQGLKFSDMVFIVASKSYVQWRNETILKYRTEGGNSFKLVTVANMSDANFKSMREVFAATWNAGIANSAVLLANATSTALFTYFPFRNSTTCEDTTPIRIEECSGVPEGRSKVWNLNGCPLRVSLIDDRPFARYPWEGRLIELIYEISRRMNFTVEPMTPDSPDTEQAGGTCDLEEYSGTRGDVFSGRADMAVSSFIREACSTLEYISLPYTHCLTWCTPVMSGREYIYLFIIQQFQPSVWFALILTIAIIVCSVYYISSVTQDKVSLKDSIYFFVVMFVPVPIKAQSAPVRIVLGLWTLCSVVIRSTYEGEMESESAVPIGSHIIRSLEELADLNLKLCTTLESLNVLKQIDDPVVQVLHQKTRVCQGSLYENMIFASKFKDRAIFTSDLRCGVVASEISKTMESTTLYPKTGGCFITYQFSLIVTLRGSPYKERWRILQQRCIEGGLVNKWIDLRPARRGSGQVEAYSTAHLLPALLVLLLGWILGFLVFVVENVIYKWSFEDEILNEIIDTPAPTGDRIARKNTLPTEILRKNKGSKNKLKAHNTFKRLRRKSK